MRAAITAVAAGLMLLSLTGREASACAYCDYDPFEHCTQLTPWGWDTCAQVNGHCDLQGDVCPAFAFDFTLDGSARYDSGIILASKRGERSNPFAFVGLSKTEIRKTCNGSIVARSYSRELGKQVVTQTEMLVI